MRLRSWLRDTFTLFRRQHDGLELESAFANKSATECVRSVPDASLRRQQLVTAPAGACAERRLRWWVPEIVALKPRGLAKVRPDADTAVDRPINYSHPQRDDTQSVAWLLYCLVSRR